MKQLHQQIPKGDKIWLVGVSTGRYKEIFLMNLQQKNHKKNDSWNTFNWNVNKL